MEVPGSVLSVASGPWGLCTHGDPGPGSGDQQAHPGWHRGHLEIVSISLFFSKGIRGRFLGLGHIYEILPRTHNRGPNCTCSVLPRQGPQVNVPRSVWPEGHCLVQGGGGGAQRQLQSTVSTENAQY